MKPVNITRIESLPSLRLLGLIRVETSAPSIADCLSSRREICTTLLPSDACDFSSLSSPEVSFVPSLTSTFATAIGLLREDESTEVDDFGGDFMLVCENDELCRS